MLTEHDENILIPVTPYNFSNQLAGSDSLGNQVAYGQKVTNLRSLQEDKVGPETNLDEVISVDEKDPIPTAIEEMFTVDTEILELDIGEEKTLVRGDIHIVLRRNASGYIFEMQPIKSRRKDANESFVPGIHSINWYQTIRYNTGTLVISNTEGHEGVIVSDLKLNKEIEDPRHPPLPFNFVDTTEDIKAAIAHKFPWLTEEDMRLAHKENAYIEELEKQIAKIMQSEKKPTSANKTDQFNGTNWRLTKDLYGPAVDVFNQIGRGPHEISFFAHYDYFSLVEIAATYYGVPIEDLSPSERQEAAFDFLLELENRIKPMEEILQKYEIIAFGYSPVAKRLSEQVSERFIIDESIMPEDQGLCYQGQDAIVLKTSRLSKTIDDDVTANAWIEMLAEIAVHERGHLLSHVAQQGFEYEEIFVEARVHLARYLMNPENYQKYFTARYDERIEFREGVPYIADKGNIPQGAKKLALETLLLAKKADIEDVIVNGHKLTGDEVIASMIGTSSSRRLYSTDDRTSKLNPRIILFGELYDLTHELKFKEAFNGCTNTDYAAYKDETLKANQENRVTSWDNSTLTEIEKWLIKKGVVCPKEFGD